MYLQDGMRRVVQNSASNERLLSDNTRSDESFIELRPVARQSTSTEKNQNLGPDGKENEQLLINVAEKANSAMEEALLQGQFERKAHDDVVDKVRARAKRWRAENAGLCRFARSQIGVGKYDCPGCRSIIHGRFTWSTHRHMCPGYPAAWVCNKCPGKLLKLVSAGVYARHLKEVHDVE